MGNVKTGIPGFDGLIEGGFREGSVNLVSGTAGTGKTLFGLDFLINGAELYGEKGLFITLEEGRENIISDLPKEKQAILKKRSKEVFFIDLSVLTELNDEDGEHVHHNSVRTLVEVALEWIKQRGIKRVVIDGMVAIFISTGCESECRKDITQMAQSLRTAGVTSIITSEITEHARLSRFGVEEYVSDSITILGNDHGARSVEVVKVRGQGFVPGKHSLAITGDGLRVFPGLAMQTVSTTTRNRVKTGIAGLDEMLNGGFIEGDVVLLTGAAGTGKTIFGLEFVAAGLAAGEKCLFVSHEESKAQLKRNAKNLGIDLDMYEKRGLLETCYIQPNDVDFNQYAWTLLDKAKGATRIVIDPITDYIQRVPAAQAKDQMARLASHFKSARITTLMTAETPDLIGSTRVTDTGTSFVVDTILILRYVELGSEMKRALNVLKIRGSAHDKDIREFAISKDGISILGKFEGVDGLITGFYSRRMSKRVEKFFD